MKYPFKPITNISGEKTPKKVNSPTASSSQIPSSKSSTKHQFYPTIEKKMNQQSYFNNSIEDDNFSFKESSYNESTMKQSPRGNNINKIKRKIDSNKRTLEKSESRKSNIMVKDTSKNMKKYTNSNQLNIEENKENINYNNKIQSTNSSNNHSLISTSKEVYCPTFGIHRNQMHY